MRSLFDLLIISLLHWCGSPVEGYKWYLVLHKTALEAYTNQERSMQALRVIFSILF